MGPVGGRHDEDAVAGLEANHPKRLVQRPASFLGDRTEDLGLGRIPSDQFRDAAERRLLLGET
jgi:hypothetical protein